MIRLRVEIKHGRFISALLLLLSCAMHSCAQTCVASPYNLVSYNWMNAQCSSAGSSRQYSTTGDILIDNAHNVYSIGALGQVLQIVKYTSSGTKTADVTYGAIANGGTADPSKIAIAKAIITNDDSSVFIAGHARDSTLTGGSTTFNIFLQRVKASDLSTVWARNWGLDGAD